MSAPLVARDDELGRLLDLIRTRTGAVIIGDAGVGKTTLASALASRYGDAGEAVVWMVATEAGRGMPFGALAPLMPQDVTTIHPALVPNLVARHLDELAATARPRRSGPPLLVLDDAHLLDEQSAVCVLGLITHWKVRLLATIRSGSPVPDAVTSLWKDGFCERVDLAPLDREGSRALLATGLGGEVAGATAELLWQHTRGNPLFLTELVRFGTEEARFTFDGGLWTWQGELGVPPRLAELLQRRFDGLSAEAHDALATIAMCEPIRFDNLVAITSDEGVAELEARRLVATVDEGPIWLRFAHPLLGAIAGRNVTRARRHRLAERLLDVCDWADEVRRASWQLESGRSPDVELLLKAADDVLLSDPGLSARFARRALDHDDGPRAAVGLADAYAELGRPADARSMVAEARARIRTDDDRVPVKLSEVSLTTWSDRRPAIALAELRTFRAEMPERFHAEIDSAVALIALFAGKTAEALTRAEDVLDRRPPHRIAVRASIARVAALALAGRTGDAVRIGEHLLAVIDAQPVRPYATGLAHVAAALAYLCRWEGATMPVTAPRSGRWPMPPPTLHEGAAGPRAVTESFAWPLLEGVQRHMAGDLAGAEPHLREALVQQRSGEGLFRSEVAAGLIIVLAGTGQTDEAERVLADEPADGVAVIPGLRAWAEAAVAAARGRLTLAAELAEASAREAGGAGALVPALWAITDAARYGAPAAASAYLDELEESAGLGQAGSRIDSPLVHARVAGIRARARGDATTLLDAADRHASLGLLGEAVELADLAAAAPGSEASGTRAKAVRLSQRLRDRLGLAPPTAAPTLALTRRELEVASLAAQGMTDRDIADTLVVSVRTVESHLAASYRKLGIASRRELQSALAPGAVGHGVDRPARSDPHHVDGTVGGAERHHRAVGLAARPLDRFPGLPARRAAAGGRTMSGAPHRPFAVDGQQLEPGVVRPARVDRGHPGPPGEEPAGNGLPSPRGHPHAEPPAVGHLSVESGHEEMGATIPNDGGDRACRSGDRGTAPGARPSGRGAGPDRAIAGHREDLGPGRGHRRTRAQPRPRAHADAGGAAQHAVDVDGHDHVTARARCQLGPEREPPDHRRRGGSEPAVDAHRPHVPPVAAARHEDHRCAGQRLARLPPRRPPEPRAALGGSGGDIDPPGLRLTEQVATVPIGDGNQPERPDRRRGTPETGAQGDRPLVAGALHVDGSVIGDRETAPDARRSVEPGDDRPRARVDHHDSVVGGGREHQPDERIDRHRIGGRWRHHPAPASVLVQGHDGDTVRRGDTHPGRRRMVGRHHRQVARIDARVRQRNELLVEALPAVDDGDARQSHGNEERPGRRVDGDRRRPHVRSAQPDRREHSIGSGIDDMQDAVGAVGDVDAPRIDVHGDVRQVRRPVTEADPGHDPQRVEGDDDQPRASTGRPAGVDHVGASAPVVDIQASRARYQGTRASGRQRARIDDGHLSGAAQDGDRCLASDDGHALRVTDPARADIRSRYGTLSAHHDP